jgi:hypothetical protein
LTDPLAKIDTVLQVVQTVERNLAELTKELREDIKVRDERMIAFQGGCEKQLKVDERIRRYAKESDPLKNGADYDALRVDGKQIALLDSEWYKALMKIKTEIPL